MAYYQRKFNQPRQLTRNEMHRVRWEDQMDRKLGIDDEMYLPDKEREKARRK